MQISQAGFPMGGFGHGGGSGVADGGIHGGDPAPPPNDTPAPPPPQDHSNAEEGRGLYPSMKVKDEGGGGNWGDD